MFGKSKHLGLAVTEQGITAALVVPSGSWRTILRTARLPFTDQVHLGQPERLGQELKGLLAREGMTASHCVIGLAASWIASREKMLPPMDAESLRGALVIVAEREFASGAGDLAFDYIASESPKGSVAMLAAAPRQVIDQLLAAAREAGLTVASVTSSTMALAEASRGVIVSGGRLVLCLLPGGVELALQSAKGLRLLRHLPVRLQVPATSLNGLSQELQRVMSLAPSPQDASSPREVLLWDSLGLDRSTLESIGRTLGVPARICTLPADVENLTGSAASTDNQYAQAAALVASDASATTMNFLHSRLAPPAPARFGRRSVWIAAAAAVVLIACATMVIDHIIQARELDNINDQLAAVKASSEQAKSQLDDYTFAQSWFDRRPAYLDCLKELTIAFPQTNTTWTTHLKVGEDMQAQLTVKAVNDTEALELQRQIEKSPALANVKHKSFHRSSNKSGEVSFDLELGLRGGR